MFVEQLSLLINMFMLNLLGNSSFYFFVFASRSFMRSFGANVLCMVMCDSVDDDVVHETCAPRSGFMVVHTWREIHTRKRFTCDDNCCRRLWIYIDGFVFGYSVEDPSRSDHLRFTVRYCIFEK